MTTMDWPKHPDGRNKKMGEMTLAEQRQQWTKAAKKLQAEFEAPAFREAVSRILGDKK